MKLPVSISYILLAACVFTVQTSAVTLNYVGGRIYTTCDIAVGEDTIAANLIIDIGMAYPLILDREFAATLDSKDSTTTVIFSKSSRLANIKFQTTELNELREYSKKYAAQLNEIPICGIIGFPAFENTAISLDIQAGKLEYGDAVSAGGDWQSVDLIPPESGGFRVEVSPAADYTLKAAITTGSYDTWLDADCAAIAGSPGGDFPLYKMGAINIMEYTAVRPFKYEGSHPDALIANSFWQNFQIVFDPEAKKIRLRSKGKKLSDLNEQIYFKALIDEDAEAIESYLDAYPASRLAEEAIETLLRQRLADSSATADDVNRVVGRMVKMLQAKIAAEKLLGYAESLFSKQDDKGIVPLLLEQAKNCCMKSPDAAMLGFEAQGQLGRYMLAKQNWPQARLHLLSALFGQPANPKFNYWMGQYYQANGQLSRAWSRYLKACIADNAPTEAFTAIGLLNENPEFRNQFSMADAYEYLEDHIPTFEPAQLPDALNDKQLRLIEIFTSVNSAACAYAELALKALDDVNGFVIASYHIDKSNGEPYANTASKAAAQKHDVNSLPAVFVNGTPIKPALLQSEDPRVTLNAIAAITPAEIKSFSLQIAADTNSRIFTITIPPQEVGENTHCEIYLVERRSMLPSSSLGMYYNIVRACLHKGAIDNETKCTADISKIQAENLEYCRAYETEHKVKFITIPAYIDAKMCFVLAKIYSTNGKLSAIGKQSLYPKQDDSNAP
jgi:hypothetical protein